VSSTTIFKVETIHCANWTAAAINQLMMNLFLKEKRNNLAGK
jgi:hypothetical protein